MHTIVNLMSAMSHEQWVALATTRECTHLDNLLHPPGPARTGSSDLEGGAVLNASDEVTDVLALGSTDGSRGSVASVTPQSLERDTDVHALGVCVVSCCSLMVDQRARRTELGGSGAK